MTTTIMEGQWGNNVIGRMEDDGVVYDDQWGGNVIAHLDGNRKRLAGAASVLLLGSDW